MIRRLTGVVDACATNHKIVGICDSETDSETRAYELICPLILWPEWSFNRKKFFLIAAL